MNDSRRLNGNSRRTVESGELPVIGSDEYHRELTMNRRDRRHAIRKAETGDDVWEDEEVTQAGPPPALPPPSLKERAQEKWKSNPATVIAALTALVGAISAAAVSIIEALK
jgi:hypothetical protein